MHTIPTTRTCLRCLREAELTNWLPPKGYDQRLRKYHCAGCGAFFFYALKVELIRGGAAV